jgi:hypothetical protein
VNFLFKILLTILTKKPLARSVVNFFNFLLTVFANKPLAKVFFFKIYIF